jgi:phospholipid transport system substrate-binding protein
MKRVNQVVDQYIFPYVDFKKTTRVAAGRFWRQMTNKQQTDLIHAFRNKLVLIYSSALSQITHETKLKITTVRKVPQGQDVIVGSALAHPNKPIIKIAYRLEKTSQGWKIYDLNVENVWLIETYRHQFSQEINQHGIDGLIQSLKNQIPQ